MKRVVGQGRLVAALLSGALLLAGCGSSSLVQTTNSTATDSPTASSSTSTSTSTSTPTTSSTSTTSTLPGSGRPSVTLGDKNTTEQFILGELYDLALSAQGFQVSLTRNIGPPGVSYQALEQGNLSVYPEYLNVWNDQVVHATHQAHSVAGAYVLGETWAADHQLELLTPTPGSDTSGIAVTSAFARQNHLRTLADLARLSPTLSLGVPLGFAPSSIRLPELEATYGLTPANTETVVIGDQYGDLQTGKVQAAYIQSTDAQLSSPLFRALGDPRHVYGFGNIVPVVTASTLAAEGPAFVEILNRVDALLTTRVLRSLNAQVDLQHLDPLAVAKQFLEQRGVVSSSTAP